MDLWKSFGATLLLKQVHLELIAQDQVLNISKDGDFTTSLANLRQCSITLTVKKHFLCLDGTSTASLYIQ